MMQIFGKGNAFLGITKETARKVGLGIIASAALLEAYFLISAFHPISFFISLGIGISGLLIYSTGLTGN